MARPNTAPVRHPDGSRTITLKRCCNGCDEMPGDATDAEIAAAADGRPLPDVRPECPTCTPASNSQCPKNPGGEHAFRPAALDPGRWCAYCGTPEAAAR